MRQFEDLIIKGEGEMGWNDGEMGWNELWIISYEFWVIMCEIENLKIKGEEMEWWEVNEWYNETIW